MYALAWTKKMYGLTIRHIRFFEDENQLHRKFCKLIKSRKLREIYDYYPGQPEERNAKNENSCH